jgi:hypothetical protein
MRMNPDMSGINQDMPKYRILPGGSAYKMRCHLGKHLLTTSSIDDII